MMKSKLSAFTATAALLAGASSASADNLALFDFQEFRNHSYALHLGPYQNTAESPLVVVTPMSPFGIDVHQAHTTADDTAAPLGSWAALLAVQTTRNTDLDSPTDNYLAFSMTAAEGTRLSNFSFDFGISNVSDLQNGLDAKAQVFYSRDGGQTFLKIGDVQQHTSPPPPEDYFSGMINSSIDLGEMPLEAGESIEFRVAFGTSRSYANDMGGVYVDNFLVQGGMIPEPGMLGIVGLGGLTLLRRRRMT